MRGAMSAYAAISLGLFLGMMPPALAAGPEGSWLCMLEAAPIGTLGIRPTSYVLIRAGKAVVVGDQQTAEGNITIVSGPLKDEMGISAGVLDETQSPRMITFTGESGTLACREVR